jgi:hypothetical protein
MARRSYFERAYGQPALRNQGGAIEKALRVPLSNPDVVCQRTIDYVEKKARLRKKKKECHEQLMMLRDLQQRIDSNGIGISDDEKDTLSTMKNYYETQRELDETYQEEDEYDKSISVVGALFWFIFMTLPKCIWFGLKFLFLVLVTIGKTVIWIVKMSITFCKQSYKLLGIDRGLWKAKDYLHEQYIEIMAYIRTKYCSWKLARVLKQLNQK